MQKLNNSNGFNLILGAHIYISKLQWQKMYTYLKHMNI